MHTTPLRYPGGKAKLAPLIRRFFVENNLLDGQYAEPYAGGAGIAFDLLFLEHASHVHLNDLDRSVFCFWQSVITNPEWFCKRIADCRITISEWKRQKAIYKESATADPEELGFALFFLNRTNRSGILTGGIIGGLDQTGEWKIDARFGRKELTSRVQKIANYRSRISLYNVDAARFIENVIPRMPEKALIYLDPPYFLKGKRLYQNHYKESDHAAISERIQSSIKQKWIVSYDYVPEILSLYSNRRRAIYNLQYSAGPQTLGTEVMFFSDQIQIPSLSKMRLYTPKGFYDRAANATVSKPQSRMLANTEVKIVRPLLKSASAIDHSKTVRSRCLLAR